MSEQNFKRVNIHLASLEELIDVPGIGPVLAKRIIDGRPYDRLEDLVRVQGINEKLLSQLEEYLSDLPIEAAVERSPDLEIIEDVEQEIVEVEPEPVVIADGEVTEISEEGEEPQAVIEMEESGLVEAVEAETEAPKQTVEEAAMETKEPSLLERAVSEAEKADLAEEPAAEAQEAVKPAVPEAPAEKKLTSAATAVPTEPPAKAKEAGKEEKAEKGGPRRGEMLGYNFGFAILALLLAVLLTLGVLAAINGTLVYAPARRFVDVERRVGMTEAEIDLLKQDVEGLRTRIDALEALSGRVSDLEATTETMRAELDTYSAQLEQLDERVLQLDERTAELEKSAKVFDEFLQGLKSLLLQVMPEDTGATQPAK